MDATFKINHGYVTLGLQSVLLCFLDYVPISIDCKMFKEAVTEGKHIRVDNIDSEHPAVSTTSYYNSDSNGFIISTEESYTDNLDDQDMALFRIPFTKEIKNYLLYEDEKDI